MSEMLVSFGFVGFRLFSGGPQMHRPLRLLSKTLIYQPEQPSIAISFFLFLFFPAVPGKSLSGLWEAVNAKELLRFPFLPESAQRCSSGGRGCLEDVRSSAKLLLDLLLETWPQLRIPIRHPSWGNPRWITEQQSSFPGCRGSRAGNATGCRSPMAFRKKNPPILLSFPGSSSHCPGGCRTGLQDGISGWPG